MTNSDITLEMFKFVSFFGMIVGYADNTPISFFIWMFVLLGLIIVKEKLE